MSTPLSQLIVETKEKKPVPYTEEEKKYYSAIIKRLFDAKQTRDTTHPEFDGSTFIENYEENEKVANSVIPKKHHDGDVRLTTGTVEQKLFSVLSEINRLRLAPEVIARDSDNNELVQLGHAMSDIIAQTEELDEGDGEEGKILRQLELLKQGTVFIQDRWVKEWSTEKNFNKKDIGKIDVKWSTRLKKCYEGPRREVLYGPGVYLGNIRDWRDIKFQPYLFTHKLTTIEDIKSRYHNWERLEHVSDQNVSALSTETLPTAYAANDAWGLVNVKKGFVEEIHYMDKFNNEYQIFLNGVAMLPVGFPLSAVSDNGEYPIVKQVLQFINPQFAYGRSFIAKVRKQSDLLDELLRLLIVKTRKSIHPPYVNMSGRVISPKVLNPGRISMGISPDALQPIGAESQGATASEYQMFKMLSDNIDEMTVSKQFTGQQGKSGTTAYEVATLQKQAQKTLSLLLFACTMMEMKLGWQRLDMLLENYFEPTEMTFDKARQAIKNKYRTTTRTTQLPGQGDGMRQVIPTDDLPTSGKVAEEQMYTPNGRNKRVDSGMSPLKRIYIKPSELKKAKIVWSIDVDTRERETSNVKKMMFREELADIITLMNIGAQPNIKALEEEHANVWNRRQGKFFSQGRPQPQAQSGDKEKKPGGPGTAAPPNVGALNVAGE